MSGKKKTPRKRGSPSPIGAAKAFLDSAAHQFQGKKLQPYTPSRVVAAQAMGLLYPNVGPEGLAQLRKVGIYPGELKDMIIVLWLCLREEDDQILSAQMDPIAAYGAAEKWAGRAGLCDMSSLDFMYGLALFQIIMGEIGDSKTTPVTAAGSSRAESNEDEAEDPKD